jgi:hypothetical protein
LSKIPTFHGRIFSHFLLKIYLFIIYFSRVIADGNSATLDFTVPYVYGTNCSKYQPNGCTYIAVMDEVDPHVPVAQVLRRSLPRFGSGSCPTNISACNITEGADVGAAHNTAVF